MYVCIFIAHSFAKFSIVFQNVVGRLKVAMSQRKLGHYYFDVISFGTSCMREYQTQFT
jgi:hypothetical protein